MSQAEWGRRLENWKYRWGVTENTRQTSPWYKSKIVYVAPSWSYQYPNPCHVYVCSQGPGRVAVEDYALMFDWANAKNWKRYGLSSLTK